MFKSDKIPLFIIRIIQSFLKKNSDIFTYTEKKHNQNDINIVGIKYKDEDYFFDFYIRSGALYQVRYRPQSEHSTNIKLVSIANLKQVQSFLNHWEKLVKEYHSIKTNTRTLTTEVYYLHDIAQSRITSIAFQNFKIFQKLTLKLNPKINIFLGKNSSGKTSILQGITLALLATSNKDKDRDFEPFIRKGEDKSDLNIIRDNIGYQITINDRYKMSPNDVLEPILLAYGANIFYEEKRNKYIETTEKIIFEEEKDYHTKSIFQNYDFGFVEPLAVLNRLVDEQNNFEKQQEIKKSQEIHEIITTLVKTLNQLIPDFDIKTKDRVYYFFDKQNQHFTTDELSEGYRANAVLLSDILFKIMMLRNRVGEETSISETFQKAKGVILIDEFDRHLHPSWQRIYLKNLTEVLPNIQFFLTTHNPMAILDRNAEEIQVLYRDENGEMQVLQQEGGTKYAGVSLTILKYFDDTTVSETLKNALENYYDLLEDEPDSPKLETLRNDLREAYPGITLFDHRYLTFLQFLKNRNLNIDDFEARQKFDFTDEEWDELEKELFENE